MRNLLIPCALLPGIDTEPTARKVAFNDPKCSLDDELGTRPGDVVLRADRAKRDAFRADRADGIIVKNMAFEQATFNGLDIVETDGSLIDDVIGRYNQNYGILTFTSDNGLNNRTEGYGMPQDMPNGVDVFWDEQGVGNCWESP